jgi:putative solute:sodium symporter small subunit
MTTSAKHSAALEPVRIPSQRDMASYWAANVRLIIGLLLIWFGVTFLPILFVNQLNQIEVLTGFPLGYYMGAQGSLIVFILLVVFYAWRMERLDQAYSIGQE